MCFLCWTVLIKFARNVIYEENQPTRTADKTYIKQIAKTKWLTL